MKTSMWAMSVSALLLLGLAIGSRNVEARVQKQFRGLVRITMDADAPKLSFELIKLVVEVPESGELRLPDLDVVRRWHRQTASFSNALPLPVLLPGDTFEGLALHMLPTPPTQQVFWFVGTQDEVDAYWKANWDRLYSVNEGVSKLAPAK